MYTSSHPPCQNGCGDKEEGLGGWSAKELPCLEDREEETRYKETWIEARQASKGGLWLNYQKMHS